MYGCRSPETLIPGEDVTEKADSWSLGILIQQVTSLPQRPHSWLVNGKAEIGVYCNRRQQDPQIISWCGVAKSNKVLLIRLLLPSRVHVCTTYFAGSPITQFCNTNWILASLAYASKVLSEDRGQSTPHLKACLTVFTQLSCLVGHDMPPGILSYRRAESSHLHYKQRNVSNICC